MGEMFWSICIVHAMLVHCEYIRYLLAFFQSQMDQRYQSSVREMENGEGQVGGIVPRKEA